MSKLNGETNLGMDKSSRIVVLAVIYEASWAIGQVQCSVDKPEDSLQLNSHG